MGGGSTNVAAMSQIKWPISNTELAELLGYAVSAIRSRKRRLKDRLIEGDDFSYKDRGATYTIIWYESGAVKLASTSRKAKAKAFLQKLGIVERTEVSDESRTLDIICAALEGLTTCQQQYPVIGSRFRIDLYLPELRIAVECDERGHSSYPKQKERIRQQWIEKQLNCRFERYDPNVPTDVGHLIKRLFRAAGAFSRPQAHKAKWD